jgi:hypothetical protein
MSGAVRERLLRIGRFLSQRSEQNAYRFEDVPDPRARRGLLWPLAQQLRAVWLGFLVGASSIRQVESMTQDLGTARRRNGRSDRLPDSTVEYVLPDIEWRALRDKLILQVHDMERAKVLDPVGLPLGVLAVDGKTLGSYDNEAGGWGQKSTREDGSPYWLVRVLRAVLVTAPTKPCIDQIPIPADTNDMGAFATMFRGLMTAYGRSNLFEIVSEDAGFTSLENATLVDEAHKAYWMGLKGNQPEMLAEARRQLEPTIDPVTRIYRVAPEAETPWERHKGTRIRRQLWRTRDMAGWGDWTHLRQVVLVRQTTEDPSGCKAAVIEDRYFVTNMISGRLNGEQLLTLTRLHWGIENNCFGALDVQWLEDSRLCCRQGNAPLVLGLLRVMAYNVLGWLRGRHLRSEANRAMTWRELFDRVRMALVLSLALADCPAMQEPTPSA